MYKIEYACINTIGKVRESNQDNFYCKGRYRYGNEKFNDISLSGVIESAENRILAVLDGMGGEACGDKASLVSAAGADSFDGVQGSGRVILYDMSMKLNSLVCEYAEYNRVGSMGSTLAAVRFSDAAVSFTNLGDSRIFRITDGSITQISCDHVVPNYHKPKAPLTQFLGLPVGDYIIEPFITEETPVPDTKYLLCSDGITDMVSESDVMLIINESPDMNTACTRLVERALNNGGYDNITAILCKISDIY